jgi:nitroreductase
MGNELEKIINRRSCRKFLNKEVSDELIYKLIDCARNAPFGGPAKPSSQVSEFIIIRDKGIKKELAFNYEDRQFIINVPVIIACCANTSNDPKYKEWIISASLSIQNIIIGAELLNLSTCFVSCFVNNEEHIEEKQKLRATLNLAENIELISLLAVGYRDSTEEIKPKILKDINDIIKRM